MSGGADDDRPSKPVSQSTALAVVAHWAYDQSGRHKRTKGLRRVLLALSSFDVRMRVLLVTNHLVPEVDDLVAKQVVRPDPRCGPRIREQLCMPWEAIRALRKESSGQSTSCDLDGWAVCGSLAYDYYLFMEDDIMIPPDTFSFWKRHVDGLYSLGYLLLPYRRERWPPDRLTDCFDFGCPKRTRAAWDRDGAKALYDNLWERVYLKPDNPFAACWLMTRAQFQDYLASDEWNPRRKNMSRPYLIVEQKTAGMSVRSQASGGLVWDPHFGPDTVLTHLKMPVVHLFSPWMAKSPASKNFLREANATRRSSGYGAWLALYEEKVKSCISNIESCRVLTSRYSEGRVAPKVDFHRVWYYYAPGATWLTEDELTELEQSQGS
eukprot:gnl/TRDRNA2_/TRDRNA2_60804_c0_seq1.p1 gnl/TRDRNA2_/TRDRNA2_60804_c0~~gnl/TRDRNA2_/TRDRNA2_60804_c0_seq1.p1  ORF type:complete len:379 (-),score=29.75 gnl/TRDRNA2_/TRDRNA2_60804_c0_seq1:123-1259(-)